MALTYYELTSKVPKKTLEFINKVLPYMDYYCRKDHTFSFHNVDTYITSAYGKRFFLCAYIGSTFSDIESLFSRFGFDKSNYRIHDVKTENPNYEELYRSNSYFLPNISDAEFEHLTILDIIIHNLQLYIDNYGTGVLSSQFPLSNSSYSLFGNLNQINNEEKRKIYQAEENKLFKNLPISSISYLEIASKIMEIIQRKELNPNITNKSLEDMVALSLFIAIYYYQDPIVDEEDISVQSIIKEIFENNGLEISQILSLLGINISSKDIANTKVNLYTIRDYYQAFLQSDDEKKKMYPLDIIQNLFNRSISNSYILERIMANFKCYIGLFDNLDKDVNKLYQNKKILISESYVKSFYENLTKDVKDYINFSTKIYSIITRKMQSSDYHSDILKTEDDADTLALFIASYYYSADVSEFFLDHGITLVKVLELLNLSITKEEIDQEELSTKALINRYKRFVYDGVNYNKNAKELTIDDIAHNLCSREFNRSTIMEEIFETLSSDNLEKNFLTSLQEHFAKKKNQHIQQLSNELFRDLPIATVEYLERVSRVHQYLSEKLKNYSKDNIKTLSLLICTLYDEESTEKKFFESLGFNLQKIGNYLDLSPYYFTSKDVDVDTINEEYLPYIFSGFNQEKDRKNITILSIAHNIFSREFNSDIQISKFLKEFKLSYEDFEDFDKLYNRFLDDENAKKEREDKIRTIEDYDYSTSTFLKKALKLFKALKEKISRNDYQNPYLITQSDAIELSMLLATLSGNYSINSFFEKNGISLDLIYNSCDIKEEDLIRAQEEVDYSLSTYFEPYLIDEKSTKKYIPVETIIKRLFNPSINSSLLLEKICASNGVNYERLAEEIISGKDYEASLSMDDRIALLDESTVDTMDISSVKSIMHFGTSLTKHSKFIYDELPKLTSQDSLTKSIATIEKVLGNVYKSEKIETKPKSFWAKFFTLEIEEESTKTVINPEGLSELNKSIDQSIKEISEELIGFDSIRRYMEIYRRKNMEYYEETLKTEKEIEDELKSLNPNDENDFNRLAELTSLLQIIRSKKNRFATTNHIIKQELIRINQTISNHFITINALEMARNDLLPLIGSELAIGRGRNTENEALEISKNVIGLFQSLLDKNALDATKNMELLKSSSMPAELVDALNQDILLYISDLDNQRKIKDRVEPHIIDSDGEKIELIEFATEESPRKPEEKPKAL